MFFLDKFIERISSYNILNNLIPGTIFVWLCDVFDIFSVSEQAIIEKIFIYYFGGIVIGRVGSLFVEPIIKLFYRKKGFHAPHAQYIEACDYDKKIEELNAVSNMYRTFISVAVCILFAKVYVILKDKMVFLQEANIFIILAFLFILFLLSYTKQVKYIKSRINVALKRNNKAEKETQK